MVDADRGDVTLGRPVEQVGWKRLLGHPGPDHSVTFRARRQAICAETRPSCSWGFDVDPARGLPVPDPRGLAVGMADVPVAVMTKQGDERSPRPTGPAAHEPQLDGPTEAGHA